MICVSIGRGRHRHVIAEHRHLAEQGAGLVELRLDYLQSKVNIKRLIDDRPCGVIITCRRERDGGRFNGTEEDRLLLLRTAIAEGVEYVDLEDDVAAKIPRFGKTKRIVSLHDFRKTPDNLPEIHARLAALNADIVKIATLANHPQDNVRMFELMRTAKVPTVGICMGEIGAPTRILAGRFGSPFTYATFSAERALAPGQLSYEQMTQVYHYDDIDAQTEVYGVVGDPIGHSLSPLIHNAAFHHLGLNKVYVPFRVPRGDLASFIDQAHVLGIHGLSVTIPHKEAVIRKLHQVDGAVRGVGAANTVVFHDGRGIGYNTDYRAAMDCLELAFDPHRTQPEGSVLAGKSALVLGSGGVSRAIAFGLRRRGADVVVANRTSDRAEHLAEQAGCRAVDWSARHSVDAAMLINGTPVGMHPNVDESPFDKLYLKQGMVVFDTVYNPENTLLVKDARSKGCRVVTGVELFVRQAALQFKHFTGQDAPVDVMRAALKRAIGAVKV